MANAPHKRILLTAAAALASLAFGNPGLAADAEGSQAAPSVSGVVGVCVRWADDDHHLAEAIVVEPSGDSTLDTLVPNTLRGMTWNKPAGYGGEWLGLSVGVDGAKPSDKLPDCGGLGETSMRVPLKAKKGKLI
jgi:hypothetical protein